MNGHNDCENSNSTKFSDFGDDEMSGMLSSDNDATQSPPTSPSQSLSSSPIIPKIVLPISENEKRRRSTSWQTKMERRRSSRKNSTSNDTEDDTKDDSNDSPPINYHRQKRHSWWNILVPDNIKHRWILFWLDCSILFLFGFDSVLICCNAVKSEFYR